MSELAGIDFSQYANWETITAPTGAVYYVVPGTGYVYDPFLSQAKGRPVLWTNPKPALDEKKKIEKEAKEAASPMNQILPVAGTVAGTVGANQLISALSPASAQDKLYSAMAQNLTSSAAPATTANAFTQAATSQIPAANSVAPELISATRIPGATPAGNSFDAVNNSLGSTASGVLGAAGLVSGGIGLHNAIDANDSTAGALSGMTAGLGGAQLATALGMSWVPGIGWVAAGGALLGLLATELLGKKSTKEIESDRWKAAGKNDLAKTMGMGGYDYFKGTGGEQSRDESLLTPDAIRNNPDNYNNIPDWDNWDRASQDKFLSTMLAEKKVREKKGGIYYDDARAKELADQIRTGKPTPAAPGSPTTPTQGQPVVMDNKRSSTKSPGIGLDGKRVGKELANRMNKRGK